MDEIMMGWFMVITVKWKVWGSDTEMIIVYIYIYIHIYIYIYMYMYGEDEVVKAIKDFVIEVVGGAMEVNNGGDELDGSGKW